MKPRLISPRHKRFKTAAGEFIENSWTGQNESGWEPLADKLVIYPDQAATTTLGGIMLTDDQTERQQMSAETGVVVAVGPGVTIPVKPGDRVFVERYGGQLAPGYDGKIYRVMDQSAIGAIHKPKMVLS